MLWKNLGYYHDEEGFSRGISLACTCITGVMQLLVKGNKKMQKKISYYDIELAFNDLPNADHFLGVMGVTLQATPVLVRDSSIDIDCH